MATPAVGRRWTVRDVVDLEHLAHLERVDEAPWFAGARRDVVSDDRRIAFLQWLDRVRSHAGTPLPGDVYSNGRQLVQWCAGVAGAGVGFGVAGALLSHRETEPVNALLFFAVTVGVQLAFVALVAIGWLQRRTAVRPAGLQRALLSLIGSLGRAVDRLDGERRAAVRAGWAALDFRGRRLAPLVGCQLLVSTQVFAIAFNVGLLASMLFVHLPFEELRFGWQSTYSFTATGVAAWVDLVAAPWRWLAPGLAPDALQVAATRFVRGQRAETLPAAAGHAWWPFLLCAIAFYGLALRTALAVLAGLLLRRRLASLDLRHPAANALWRRIRGPLVASSGDGPALPQGRSIASSRRSRGADLLVIDHDLAARDGEIRALAGRVFDGAIGTTVAAEVDDDASAAALVAALGPGRSIVVATRASRDPIVAIAAFLRALGRAAGKSAEVTVLLIGDGSSGAPAERTAIWKRFAALHRLDVGVEGTP